MADQEQVPPRCEMPLGFPVDLADQRAGGVDVVEFALPRFLGNGFRHAMRGEDHGHIVRNLLQLLDENGAFVLECPDDEPVVDDLVAHINRSAVAFERGLHNLDRANHARAEAARADKANGESGFLCRHCACLPSVLRSAMRMAHHRT